MDTVIKEWERGLEVLEMRDHPNYSIFKFDHNTDKSAGDLRRLTVYQTPMKNH